MAEMKLKGSIREVVEASREHGIRRLPKIGLTLYVPGSRHGGYLEIKGEHPDWKVGQDVEITVTAL